MVIIKYIQSISIRTMMGLNPWILRNLRKEYRIVRLKKEKGDYTLKMIYTFLFCMVLVWTTVGCDASYSKETKHKTLSELPKDYKPEDAIKNDNIVINDGVLTNIERLDKFIDNFNKGLTDEVMVTTFSIEGGSIIRDLRFDGKQIEYTVDLSRERYSQGTTKITCTGIVKRVVKDNPDMPKGYVSYVLLGCNGGTEEREVIIDDIKDE